MHPALKGLMIGGLAGLALALMMLGIEKLASKPEPVQADPPPRIDPPAPPNPTPPQADPPAPIEAPPTVQ